MEMPFGKYKGVDMRFIDSDYLEWVIKSVNDEDIVEAADEELQRKVDEGLIAFRKRR